VTLGGEGPVSGLRGACLVIRCFSIVVASQSFFLRLVVMSPVPEGGRKGQEDDE
jgi:hypothetical protein